MEQNKTPSKEQLNEFFKLYGRKMGAFAQTSHSIKVGRWIYFAKWHYWVDITAVSADDKWILSWMLTETMLH